jgi:hydrogenase-4 component B
MFMFPAGEGLSPSAALVVAGILFTACSGIPGLVLARRDGTGQKIATLLVVLGSVAGLAGAFLALLSVTFERYVITGGFLLGGAEWGLDSLSAFFLLPVFIIAGCCALYAVGYFPEAKHPSAAPRLTFFFGLLVASVVLVITARDALLFLAAWEVMALASFFALTTEDQRKEVREAGLLFLIAAHIGTLVLFAHFSLLKGETSSFAFPGPGALDSAILPAVAIFLTALVGFGFKAGIMPFHIWLPSAHAAAPSHVSAFMSGVIIKTGIYGIIRATSFFHTPPSWWGLTLLALGMVSAVAGVLFAIGQHDLKRLLAYHSIENIGIITMGIGVALIGRSSGSLPLEILGMGGALLHVLNHAIFKGLLFLGAGSVIHASGTREIDLMGGLAKRLPLTGLLFLIGAAAICGLPPLNGFVSEYLIYLSLFRGVAGIGTAVTSGVPFMALAVPALALVGGLALACFVKAYGVVFLGSPRQETMPEPHEAGRWMLIPMGVLAVLCVLIGLFPQGAVRLLEPAVASWLPASALSDTGVSMPASLGWITVMGLLLALFGVTIALIALRRRSGGIAATVTWDCGYLRPTSRMQYSASSFAGMLVDLFGVLLRPQRHAPKISGPFPVQARFSSHVPEAVLELVYLPILTRGNELLVPLRKLQHGQIPLYILYIFVTVIVLLVLAP